MAAGYTLKEIMDVGRGVERLERYKPAWA